MNDNIKIEVIYEDNHIIVIKKPVNVLSQSDSTKDPDIQTLLKKYLKEKYNKPGKVFVGLLHRLDRPVGGVMVLAKTSKAASRISKQIREGEFIKRYVAVVHGTPDLSAGKLENYLIKDEKTNTVHVTLEDAKEGKRAILAYKVIESKENFSLVEINLHTGRPHQIRVQFANIGHPLYGDQKYGADVNQPGQQIALWSYKLMFMHPTQKTVETYISIPPIEYPWNSFNLEKLKEIPE